MRILIYGINFYPELTGIGKYSGELSDWLSQHGHEVRVVTAPPYYPAWKISDGYSTTKWSKEFWGDCKIFRCPIWVPKNPTGLKRLIHLASFVLTSLPIILAQLFWRPDLIWVVEPPLFVSPIAYLGAKLCGSKTVLHIQDYEIDAARCSLYFSRSRLCR
jgi:colanic acid biosynthesis glycosyl transferase WcaI